MEQGWYSSSDDSRRYRADSARRCTGAHGPGLPTHERGDGLDRRDSRDAVTHGHCARVVVTHKRTAAGRGEWWACRLCRAAPPHGELAPDDQVAGGAHWVGCDAFG